MPAAVRFRFSAFFRDDGVGTFNQLGNRRGIVAKVGLKDVVTGKKNLRGEDIWGEKGRTRTAKEVLFGKRPTPKSSPPPVREATPRRRVITTTTQVEEDTD